MVLLIISHPFLYCDPCFVINFIGMRSTDPRSKIGRASEIQIIKGSLFNVK